MRKINRRKFLAGSAAIGAGILVAPYSRVLGANDDIRVAVIGFRSKGAGHVRSFSRMDGVRLVALCDADQNVIDREVKKIEKDGGKVKTTQDMRRIFDDKEIDAIVTATPNHWHALCTVWACQAGKDVYVEKPMTLTIREGRHLAQVARRYRAVLQVGSQQRSDEKFIRACELARNGRIGDLRTVRVEIPTRSGSADPWSPRPVPPELDYEMWLGPAPWAPYHPDRCHYKFRFVSDYSGGDVTNWGAHHLDIAQWGIGADGSGPVEVSGHGKRNATGLHDVFYDVQVDFQYAGGVKIELRSGGSGVRFQGTNGWIYVSRSKLDAGPKSVLTSKIGSDEIHLAPQGPQRTHMGRWLDCIRTRNVAGLNAPAEVGHRSATLCHLANIAMELGRTLQWDPAGERFVGDEEANRLTWRPPRAAWDT